MIPRSIAVAAAAALAASGCAPPDGLGTRLGAWLTPSARQPAPETAPPASPPPLRRALYRIVEDDVLEALEAAAAGQVLAEPAIIVSEVGRDRRGLAGEPCVRYQTRSATKHRIACRRRDQGWWAMAPDDEPRTGG